MGECTVVVSRTVFARLPSYNPFVGTFHHAPSAGNRGAVYFSGDIVGMSELEERKKFRHHPLTGTFHSLPGYYDPLHRLSQFRNDDDADADQLSHCDTDSVHSFIAVDLTDGDDMMLTDDDVNAMIGQPKSLSRMYSDSKFANGNANMTGSSVSSPSPSLSAATRHRRFSDSDADPFFLANQLQHHHHTASTDRTKKSRTSRHRRNRTTAAGAATPEQDASEGDDEHEEENENEVPSLSRPVVLSPQRTRAKTLPPNQLDALLQEMGDVEVEPVPVAVVVAPSINASGGRTSPGVPKKRKSSAGSANSSETSESNSGSSSSFETFVQTLERTDMMRSMASTEFNEGFISTGKGIFRKVGLRHSNHERDHRQQQQQLNSHDHHNNSSSSRKPSSPSRAASPRGLGLDWLKDDSALHEAAEEYTQAAPRVPLNPFVARRLTDGDEIRIMAVHRHNAPRECVPHVINSGYDTDEEFRSLPKPYFIHETAVTDQYELCGADQLGDGSYAVVKPALRRANGMEVAIKQIHKRYLTTEEAKQAVEREIEIHLRLKHRHIVRLHEVYETVDFLYLVMAKAKKGNLKQLMQRKRRLPEALAARLSQQIVRGVLFLHESGVLHCDLKPENILLTDARPTNQDSNDANNNNSHSPHGGHGHRRGSLPMSSASAPVNSLDPHADVKVCDYHIELCDFGLSVKVPDVRFYKLTGDVHKVPFTGVTGTPGYIAPELLQQQPYGKPVDMWSVGIVIFEMLTGYQPFYPAHACINEKADFTDRVWQSVSAQAKELVMGLLESDPTKRFTAADALSHGWFDTAAFAI